MREDFRRETTMTCDRTSPTLMRAFDEKKRLAVTLASYIFDTIAVVYPSLWSVDPSLSSFSVRAVASTSL